MGDLFPADSVIRRVSGEPALALGAARALLLQLAHPSVAQGVHDHSDFKRNPFKRLQGTLEATNGVVFGSEDLAHGIGRRIRWIHDFVSGPAYRANDPALLLWVHATLVDTALWCYEQLVEPLPDADREAYYDEMMTVAEIFGCPRSEQPPTVADFRSYFDDTVSSMEVSDAGRDLAGFILDPELPLRLHIPMRPLLRLNRLVTVGALPAPIRAQLHVRWDERRQDRFERTVRRTRAVFRSMPRSARTAGPRASGAYLLWIAARHVREFDERVATTVRPGADVVTAG